MITSAKASLFFIWSLAALVPMVQAAPLAHERVPYRPIPRERVDDLAQLARSLGHSLAGDLDSILERRRPFPGVFDPSHVHVYRSLQAMTKDVEEACRERGGTPEMENGEAICTMNPEPFRRPLIHLQRPFSTHRHQKSTMSPAEELQCRERGGTPELVHGAVSCEMNPTPERKILHSIHAILQSHTGHGRRGLFDNEVDQMELELPDHAL